jgi:signal transduction histidine kinase
MSSCFRSKNLHSELCKSLNRDCTNFIWLLLVSSINKIVYECVDEALSSIDSIGKQTFYDYLNKQYKVDFEKFADNFESIHEALRTFYGITHYRIERIIIRTLNDRARTGVYERSDEVTAFGIVVNVFMKETEENINRNKKIAQLSKDVKGLEVKVKEADDRTRAAEHLAVIGQTAAMVGHDIRNPLQAIVGELFLQKQEVDSLPDSPAKKSITDSIKAIEDNIFYINKIVSDLQDFAKPVTAKVDNEAVDINVVIADVLSIVPIPNNLCVQIHVENDFPIIYSSYQTLKRAITNLVQNAVQAMSDGGNLTVLASIQSDNVEIVVEDTGKGIPEEAQHNLFKPLYTTKAKGQGLGLAVVKRLVEAQGGKISFKSKQGEGARFIIELPLTKA